MRRFREVPPRESLYVAAAALTRGSARARAANDLLGALWDADNRLENFSPWWRSGH